MSAPIHFQGQDYDSLEAMPPHIRIAYQKSLSHMAHGQDPSGDPADEPAAQSFKPAWGGTQPAGGLPVPANFEAVTSLGPAVAVHERDSGDILDFPTFGPPRPQTVVRYREGFAFHTGKDLHTWRWEELASIQSDVSSQSTRNSSFTSHEYRLAKLNGEHVILDDRLSKVGGLAEQIKPPVFAHLWPPLAQRYQAGEALTFGPVTVDRQHGPQLDGKSFAWDAIQNVQVERGQLKVQLKDGQHHAVRVSKIPNIELLSRLIGVNLNSGELTYY
jgi:hypothetical protein